MVKSTAAAVLRHPRQKAGYPLPAVSVLLPWAVSRKLQPHPGHRPYPEPSDAVFPAGVFPLSGLRGLGLLAEPEGVLLPVAIHSADYFRTVHGHYHCG